MLIAGLVGMLAVTAKVIDFLRYISNLPATRSEVLTQLLAWLGAVAVVFLYGASDFGVTIDLGGVALSDVNGWTKVLVGLVIGSGASLVKDHVKARDNTDSAKVPPLIPPGV